MFMELRSQRSSATKKMHFIFSRPHKIIAMYCICIVFSPLKLKCKRQWKTSAQQQQ